MVELSDFQRQEKVGEGMLFSLRATSTNIWLGGCFPSLTFFPFGTIN